MRQSSSGDNPILLIQQRACGQSSRMGDAYGAGPRCRVGSVPMRDRIPKLNRGNEGKTAEENVNWLKR